MEKTTKQAMIHSLPFAVWMGLMFVLPTTAESYAIRSAATLATGIVCWIIHRKDRSTAMQEVGTCAGNVCASAISGILVGLAIFALWIWAPAWPYSEPVAPEGLPYAPQTCGWPLTIAKLIGSAFIIAPAEELFFRSFLYRRLIARDFTSLPLSKFDLSAFLWVVFLFTLEHDRPIAAAITGAAYGLLAIRFGISSAIIAHVTTNLVLALHVIFNNAWQFW
ncbi:MAG: CAAX prenyl protease-related protein [Kiritimatiellae bacterium]|nr:CAAX prenyl protease-related protein [Kiritimatiellia bacterium]